MLDSDTKRRLDTARDILVGKVPDPKSQVEQITIALIYKFMNDMDAQSEEFKGKRKFFAGDFARYGWPKLMHSGLGGYETLKLYAEAIAKMPENPGIPPLFRDIFKNAYLPYRDPETLKMFLKVIDEFNYDHSERLGDAYEYLLSIMSSQGDAGQFRTPRHIINFMVEIVDPKKDETILDPACGTAGFLISSYKHILKSNRDPKGNSTLTPDDKRRIAGNLKGYDISPDMVRLSLVNMYLHGFTKPQIEEYDTLTSLDRWNEHADVILANPPFMSPKGGIKPHNRFSVQSKRSEVLFVDYMAEHLTPAGRAGIIVPEGITYNNQTAFKELRKMLVETYLVAIISLPAGIFNPYSAEKTFILILDKALAKYSNGIGFFNIEDDGFDLGAQRRPIDKNDLPAVLSEIKEFLEIRRSRQGIRDFKYPHGVFILKERIAASGVYCLNSDRYAENIRKVTHWPMVALEEVLNYEQPAKYIVDSVEYNERYSTPVLTAGKTFILGYTNETEGIFEKGLPVIIFDDFTTAIKLVDFPFKVKSSAMKILHAKNEIADVRYLFSAMQRIKFKLGGHKRYWISEYSKLQIPLPPLEVQKEIVAEIEGYQKVIDANHEFIERMEKKIQTVIAWVWGE